MKKNGMTILQTSIVMVPMVISLACTPPERKPRPQLSPEPTWGAQSPHRSIECHEGEGGAVWVARGPGLMMEISESVGCPGQTRDAEDAKEES